MKLQDEGFSRRRMICSLTALGAGIAAVSLVTGQAIAGLPAASESNGTITVKDFARSRSSRLPQGGTYDHAAQELKDYEINVASTATGGGEDNCCGSATFWDGERS